MVHFIFWLQANITNSALAPGESVGEDDAVHSYRSVSSVCLLYSLSCFESHVVPGTG